MASLVDEGSSPLAAELQVNVKQLMQDSESGHQEDRKKDEVPGGGGGGGSDNPNPPQKQSPPITPSRQGQQVPVQSIPIETRYGIITAHVQGDLEQMENRGVFLTVHDIGSNSRSFLDFTENPIMEQIKLRSLLIHLDLMGQQDNQADLPDDYEFPPIKTIGEDLLVEVLDKLKIKLVVGIGEGAGANILVRFAYKHHSRVLGLVLIHLAPAGVGMLARLKSQISTGKRRFSEFSAENIVELHRLGDASGRSGQSSPPPPSEQQQLMPLYTKRVNNMNAKNIKRYAISYMNRKELPLMRDLDILLVAGSRSPYLSGTQKYFAQCDKEKTSFLKVDHVVDVLTEAPEKLAKSILLFVKGLGFLTSLTLPGVDRQRTFSGSSAGSNEESLGPVPNIRPHRMLERRRTLSMEEYDTPRPRRLKNRMAQLNSGLGVLSYLYAAYQVGGIVRQMYSTWNLAVQNRMGQRVQQTEVEQELLVVRRRPREPPENPPTTHPSNDDTPMESIINNSTATHPSNNTNLTCESEPAHPIVEINDDDDDDSLSFTSIQSNPASSHDDEECFICTNQLYDIEYDRPLATLPICMHTFHKTCIKSILKWHKRCPVCNEAVFTSI